MATQKIQQPPMLTKDITYANWKEEIEIWKDFTDLAAEKKGPAVFLSLNGQARDAVRQNVPNDKLKDKDGVKNVFDCLDKLYLKDSTCQAYEAYEDFEKFIRPPEMKISDYIIKFEQLYSKAKNHSMTISEGAVAYRLLNSAGLSESHKQLVRATVSEMKYEAMKNQLTKVFTNTCRSSSSSNLSPDINIKVESSDTYFNTNTHGCSESAYPHPHDEAVGDACDGSFCGYANNYHYQGNFRGRSRGGYFRGGRGGRRGRGSNRGNFDSKSKRENKKDGHGNVTKCFGCGKTDHYVGECPNLKDKENDEKEESW